MKYSYMLIYQSYTGAHNTEWYDDFYEAYQRYEDLRTSGKALRCDIYVKMVYYTCNKAE